MTFLSTRGWMILLAMLSFSAFKFRCGWMLSGSLTALLMALLGVIYVVLYLRRMLSHKTNLYLRPFPPGNPIAEEQHSVDKRQYVAGSLDKHHFDVIYIGSGISALTSAVLTAQAGKRVLVLEQSETLGGMLHEFEDVSGQFSYSSGLHVLAPLGMTNVLWTWITRNKAKFKRIGEALEVIHLMDAKGKNLIKTVRMPLGLEAGKQQMIKEFCPDDEPMQAVITKIYDDAKQAAAENTWQVIVRYLVPRCCRGLVIWLLETLLQVKVFRLWKKTWAQYIRELLPDNSVIQTRLKSLVLGWGGYFGNAGECPASVALFGMGVIAGTGKMYPCHGSGHLARSVLQNIRISGGEAYCFARVSKILLDDGDCATGVELENGDQIFADENVVSACGVNITYGHLLPERCRPKNFEAYARGGFHGMVAFLGFDGTLEQLGFPKEEIFIIMEDAWDTHEACHRATEAGKCPSCPIILYSNSNSVHQHVPGKTTIALVQDCSWEDFKKWDGTKIGQRGNPYMEFKDAALKGSIERLFKLYPAAKELCVSEMLATPLSLKHWCGYRTGEAYGAVLNEKRLFDMYDAMIVATGGVKGGLVICGTDSMSTSGVASAMIAGVLATTKILGNMDYLYHLLAAGEIEGDTKGIIGFKKADKKES